MHPLAVAAESWPQPRYEGNTDRHPDRQAFAIHSTTAATDRRRQSLLAPTKKQLGEQEVAIFRQRKIRVLEILISPLNLFKIGFLV